MPAHVTKPADNEPDDDGFAVSRPLKAPSFRERSSLRMALAFQMIALALDIVSVFLAFRLGYALRYRLELGGQISPETWKTFTTFAPPAITASLLLLVIFPLRGVYQIRHKYSALDYVPKIIGGYALVIAGVIILAFFFQFTPSRLIFLYVGGFGITFMIAHRLVASILRKWLWRRGIGVDRVLIIGEGQSGRRIMQSMLSDSDLGYRLVGYVGDARRGDKLHVATEHGILTCPRLGGVEDVRALIARHRVDEVLLVEADAGGGETAHVLEHVRGTRAEFRIVPNLVQISLDRVDFSEIDGVPTIGIRDASIQGWNAVVKRGIDILVASLFLLVAAIPMAVIGVLIRRDSEGDVFYRQIRVGQFGQPFTMIKFRCMVSDADKQWQQMVEQRNADGRLFKDPNDPRITRVGKVLRRYSIDELPQMINVLRGDMSLVGPRPPLPKEVAEYDDWHLQRLLVRPGMTGLWQVSGRSNLSFDEMVRLDLYYAENWTAWLDIKLLLRTVPAVVLGRGAY
jgi:exopolysaccharide biosynthesis polyprenyl glycosylphosphotransferase